MSDARPDTPSRSPFRASAERARTAARELAVATRAVKDAALLDTRSREDWMLYLSTGKDGK